MRLAWVATGMKMGSWTGPCGRCKTAARALVVYLRISYTYGMMWSCRTGLSCVGRIRWMVIWKCCKTLGGRVMTRRKRLRECTHRTFCQQLVPQGRGRVGGRWHLSGVEKGARYLLCRRRIISAVVELRQRRADFHGHLHVRLGFPTCWLRILLSQLFAIRCQGGRQMV